MKCVYCGGKIEERKVSFVYDEAGGCFFVENVSAEVCMQCGEKTYSPEVTDELLRVAKSKLDSDKVRHLEHDPCFLNRIALARPSLHEGKGIRIEDLPE